MLLMLYAEDRTSMRGALQIEARSRHGLRRARRARRRPTWSGKEPFGFIDGVSQPQLDWSGEREAGHRRRISTTAICITAGEFLLGYRNEYGLYTDRPLLDPRATGRDGICRWPRTIPSRRDLGRNGSYLVLRELRQDVRGFWRFVAAQSTRSGGRDSAGGGLGRAARCRASRWSPRAQPIRGVGPGADAVISRATSFTYDEDQDGSALSVRCPYSPCQSAHRRHAGRTPGSDRAADPHAGPRSSGPERGSDRRQPLPSHHAPRARIWPDRLSRQAAMQPDAPDPRSGLHFICLNANISRQFEFIQNAWLDQRQVRRHERREPIRCSAIASRCRPAIPPTASRCRSRTASRAADRWIAAIRHGAGRRVFLSAGRCGRCAISRR